MCKPPSNRVNDNSPTANMYGCEPCPKCHSKYRCLWNDKPNLIQCDDCGYNEEKETGGDETPLV